MNKTTEIALSPEQQQFIPADLAWNYRVIPGDISGEVAQFYIDENQSQDAAKEELEVMLGVSIEFESLEKDAIQRLLGTYYRKVQNQEKKALSVNGKTDFVDKIITEAEGLGSSDIHIEKFEEKGRVRMRIDGHLMERYTIPVETYPELVNKIKIKANLDISEKRLPQDGRIQYGDFDIRVSILPTLHGEKIVLRILGQDATNIHIDGLGMTTEEKYNYLEGIKKPNGIILISGPTGSGKTTTLYATLKLLNEEKRNIVTVEDPIEYTLDGINQVQLKEDIGLTFTSALRSFLRQDPDVIMLGEIRDGETAQMAIRAALTGHLVLSTIHTNSAWGTVSRLIDMGVPSFLLANTLNCSVAQRLVRKLCDNCKVEEEVNLDHVPNAFNREKIPNKHFVNVGCDECHFTGYKGRQALYEIIPIRGELTDKIKNEELKVEQLLKEKGVVSLSDRALELWKNGTTTLEEIYAFLIS